MARVKLAIDDHALRITVDTVVRSEGHAVGDEEPDVILADTLVADSYGEIPTLVFAHAAEIPNALDAMNRGAHDFIFLPLQPGDLFRRIERALGAEPAAHVSRDAFVTLEEAEYEVILDTLRRCNNNRAEAARRLGIGRNTLWRKLKKAQTRA